MVCDSSAGTVSCLRAAPRSTSRDTQNRLRFLLFCKVRALCESSKGNQMTPKTTRFETLLEAVPDALVGVDQRGVIRFVNRQAEVLFG